MTLGLTFSPAAAAVSMVNRSPTKCSQCKKSSKTMPWRTFPQVKGTVQIPQRTRGKEVIQIQGTA